MYMIVSEEFTDRRREIMYLAKLKSVLKDLTYSDEVLANYINDHTNEVVSLTPEFATFSKIK